MSFIIEKEENKTIYKSQGEWDSMYIAKIASVIEQIHSKSIFKYSNFTYNPPRGYQMLRFIYGNPGTISFESENVEMTLKDLLEQQENKILPENYFYSIVYQIWTSLTHLRTPAKTIRPICLHPSNIRVIPKTNEDDEIIDYECQVMKYIPTIFFSGFSEEELCFIQPELIDEIKNQTIKDCKNGDLYSFGLLIHYLFTGKMPNFEEIQNIFEEYKGDKREEKLYEIIKTENIDVDTFVLECLTGIEFGKTFGSKFIQDCKMKTFPLDNNVRFENRKLIGKGGQGSVYKCTQIVGGQERVIALKEIVQEEDLRFVEREVDAMAVCAHPNIVQYYGAFTYPQHFFDSIQEPMVYILMEYCDSGNLRQLIDKNQQNNTAINDQLFNHVVKGMIEALKYMHLLSYVHRDLKPENILFTTDPANSSLPIVKIGDFGFARKFGEGEAMSTYCGTRPYAAPEIIKNQPFGPSVDMWSLGIIIYEMKTFELAMGCDPNTIGRNIGREIKPPYSLKYWKDCVKLQEFVDNLIEFDVNQRYKIEEVDEDEYVQELYDGPNLNLSI